MRKLSRSEKAVLALHDGRAVVCQVSSRYISYGKTHPNSQAFGYPVSVDVMHNNYGDKPNRKLCELIFSLEDLELMVAQLRADVSDPA